jgi:general nucleoside transport system permease protein
MSIRSNSPSNFAWVQIRRETGRALFAAIVSLIIAFIIVLLTSKAPLEAFSVLLTAPVSRMRTVGLWVDDAVKLTLAGLAFSLVFQARQFALGVQGQIYVGAIASSFVALSPIGASWVGLPTGVVAAIVAGCVWGFLPGYAKARFGANEIVSSLMLNYVAIELCNYLVRVVFRAKPGVLASAPFPSQMTFPALVGNTRIDIGIFLAVASVALSWFVIYRTTFGLKLRVTGANPKFAEYSGIKANAIMMSAMAVSGGIGGLLGAVFVQGQGYGKITVLFEGGLGFEGILIATVAKNRPLAVPFVALAYAYLRQGAQLMNIRTDVPAEVIGIVTAIIILLVSSTYSLRFLTQIRSRLTAKGHSSYSAAEVSR